MTNPSRDPSHIPNADLSEYDWQLLVDYMANEATPQERAVVQQRLIADSTFSTVAASVFKIWQIPLPVPSRDIEAGWAAVQRNAAARMAETPASSPAPRPLTRLPMRLPMLHVARGWSSSRRWLAVAAVLLLGVVATEAVRRQMYPAYYYRGSYRSSAVATAITLPDGSHALLAPGSYLGTEHGFPARSRTVYLFGQAHFDVAPNPRVPFVVTVPGVGARVLGTTFTLRADTTPAVQIAVDHGAVAVETRDADGQWHAIQILTAGQAVHVSRLENWLAQAGYAIAGAGVPFGDAMHLGEVLRRAVIQAGAAQAARQARQRNVTPP